MPSPSRVRSLAGFFLSARWFMLAGFLLGAMALTRSVSLVYAGCAVLWIWFSLRQKKQAVVVFTMISLLTLPWMVRNTLLHNRLTGIESALGYDLYVGYHPEGSGTFQYPQSLDLMSMLDDGERDALGREKALEFIKDDPGRFVYLVIRRAGYFFGLERRALTYFYSNDFFGYIPTALLAGLAALLCLPFMLISSSAVFGLSTVKWLRETWLVLLFLVGYIGPHLFIIAEDRFHLTTVPFLVIFSASCWTAGRQAFRELGKTRAGKLGLLLASLAVIFLITNWGLEIWRDAGRLSQLFGPDGNQTFFSY